MRSEPLRGRSDVMARLLSIVRGAKRHGVGAVVLVSGPAGIGKTAVLSEICAQAATMKLRVARSRCDEVEQVRPGAPVVAMLRAGRDPLLDAKDYAEVVASIDEPLLLADRIATHLEEIAADGPLLIAIDDIQWADRVSHFLLRTLVARLVGLPVVWLLAGRVVDFGQDPIGAERVRLAPLRAKDLAAIAQDRLGGQPDQQTKRFLAAAGGNPLLAVQILDGVSRAVARGEPGGASGEFSATVAQLLAGLPGRARDLVQLVATAGRVLPVRDVAVLLPGGEAAIPYAIDSGLIVADDNGLSCRHALVAEAIREMLPAERLRELHARFATYHLAAEGDPLAAAPHARAAATRGDLDSARILVLAAEKLAGINADAAGELALLAFRTVRPGQPGWLELSRRCLTVLARTQHAAGAMTVADLIIARVDDDNLVGEIEAEAAHALWLGGRVHELTERIERVLSRSGLDRAVTARLRSARSLARTRIVGGKEAAEEAREAVAQARAWGDQDALALALQAAGEAATNQSLHTAALGHFRELRTVTGVSYLAEEITSLHFLDRYDHAQTMLDHARADGGENLEALLPAVQRAQIWHDFHLGRLDDAASGALALFELGQQLGTNVHVLDAITVGAAVALMRGDLETAESQLRLADKVTSADDQIREPGLAVMRSWAAFSGSDAERAVALLQPVLSGAAEARRSWPLWPCWINLVFRIGTAAVDHDFSDACFEIAESAAARNPGVASFAGVAMNLRGLRDRDLDTLGEAVRIVKKSPRPILRAAAAESYGRLLLEKGHRAEGITQLDHAWDDYHLMGARPSRASVQRVMRGAGARRAKWSTVNVSPVHGWDALTDAERRVAALIGAGQTNKAAAAKLGISINTVGTHIRSVFAKLGIQSRVQLAHVLHEQTMG